MTSRTSTRAGSGAASRISSRTSSSSTTELEVDTPHGPARVECDEPERDARALLVLGHGAGGGVDAPDLRTATRAALGADVAVARVLQPYRVAGKRAPAPAAQLDAAWAAVIADLSGRRLGLPQIHGGRSSGARVACRGAATLDPALRPVGVLALAFPTYPPVKPGRPQQDRTPELDAVPVPVLVIAGRTDRFGRPHIDATDIDATDIDAADIDAADIDAADIDATNAATGEVAARRIVDVRGDHALRGDLPAVAEAVSTWLDALVGPRPA